MKFHIPFTFSGIERLKKRPVFVKAFLKHKKDKLAYYLDNGEAGIDREHYLSACIRSIIASFIVVCAASTSILLLANAPSPYFLGVVIAFACTAFIGFSQLIYPKVYFTRKQKNIERNLMPALEDMLVQLSSGIPLFTILVNISASDYGELSVEFKKIVRKMNAGVPQIEVLEEIGDKNSSNYFRRTLWQISNGMKSGSDISTVIRDSLKMLNQEQVVQIQNYGNKLNPLIMFYMLVTIILPALAITFLTIISSMVGLSSRIATSLYIVLFVCVILIQIMFMGAIRSARPSLA